MNFLASPSAVLLVLSLSAIVTLQIAGDVHQIILHAKKRRPKKRVSKTVSVNYLTSDSWQAAFQASHYALLRYKSRATGEMVPKLRRKISMRLSWTLVVTATSIVATVIWLEGLIAGCLLIFLYLYFMSVVGLLAWPGSAKQGFSEKLAIALLAPFSVFFRYN